MTLEQFAWFMRQSEEQISMVILEARAHQMLFVPEEEELKAGEDAHNFLH